MQELCVDEDASERKRVLERKFVDGSSRAYPKQKQSPDSSSAWSLERYVRQSGGVELHSSNEQGKGTGGATYSATLFPLDPVSDGVQRTG